MIDVVLLFFRSRGNHLAFVVYNSTDQETSLGLFLSLINIVFEIVREESRIKGEWK